MNKLNRTLLSVIGALACTFANAQWVQDVNINTPVCTAVGLQTQPKIIADGVGGSYIVWKDYRNLNSPDAFLQRVNKDGVSLWIVDGLNVCVNQEDQSTPNICSDGENGVIATWSDFRNTTDRNIYAQRVDSNGIIQWSFNGVVVSSKSMREYNEEIISDGAGGAVIIWEQGSNNNYDIWAQRIDANGNTLWATGGIALSTANSNKLNPSIALGADNNLYAVWQDQRNGTTDVYAQKMSLTGMRLWGNAGKSVIVEIDRQEEPRMALTSDKLGIYVTWVDRRQGFLNTDIYAQRLDSAGTKKWISSALAIASSVGNQNQVEITTNGIDNGFVSVWRDYRNGGTSDIFAQKVDSNGSAIYAANGIAINTDPGDQEDAVITNDTNGGVIIAWQDKNFGNSNIRAQKIDAAGNAMWGTKANVCTAADEQVTPRIIPDGENGIVVVWEDSRDTANHNIMAQRISKEGVFIPTNIDKFDKSNIAAWPNPFNNEIFITLQSNSKAIIKLMDITGRDINCNLKQQNSEAHITLPNGLNAGIYFLQISQNASIHTVKMIKK